MALDKSAEDARPYIEAAKPTHPSVVDTEHLLAELYNVKNVPTLLWIDEAGRICRPHDSQYATDTFTQFHHKRSEPYLEMIRSWVRTGEGALTPDEVRRHQELPTAEIQTARAERALAWQLHQRGRNEAAQRHFQRAGELAPGDWTIRRGSMPILGQNPMGPEFFELAQQGVPHYAMESITPTHDGS